MPNVGRPIDVLQGAERAIVDETINEMFRLAKATGIALAGDDRAERAADALAVWVRDSRTGRPMIVPADAPGGTYRQGTLIGLTKADIVKALGFSPNVDDDPDKVENSWGFTVDGDICAVWDYYGSHHSREWSTFGPTDALKKVFGDAVKEYTF